MLPSLSRLVRYRGLIGIDQDDFAAFDLLVDNQIFLKTVVFEEVTLLRQVISL